MVDVRFVLVRLYQGSSQRWFWACACEGWVEALERTQGGVATWRVYNALPPAAQAQQASMWFNRPESSCVELSIQLTALVVAGMSCAGLLGFFSVSHPAWTH